MSKFGEYPFTRCRKPRKAPPSRTWIPTARIKPAGHEPFTESNAGVFNAPKGRFVPTPRPLPRAPVSATRRGKYMRQWAGRVMKSRQNPGWGGSSSFGRQLNFAPVNPEPGWPGTPGNTSAYGPVFPYMQRTYTGFGQEAPTGEGDPSGGAGGMGIGISIDPAAIINSITGAVQAGKDTENRPEVYLRNASYQFTRKLGVIRRDNNNLARMNDQVEDAIKERAQIRRQSATKRRSEIDYIKDRDNWLPGPAAQAKWRKAVEGDRKVGAELGARDPVRMRAAMDNEKRIGRTEVMTSKAARYQFLEDRVKHLRREANKIWTKEVRTTARRWYQDLLNVESIRPVLVQAANRDPAVAAFVQQALQAAQQGNVIARDTLADVFTDPNRFPALNLESTPAVASIVAEAAGGTLPMEYRAQQFQWYVDTWLQGYDVPTMPGWVLGAPLGHEKFLSPFPMEVVVLAATDPTTAQLLMQQRQQRIARAA